MSNGTTINCNMTFRVTFIKIFLGWEEREREREREGGRERERERERERGREKGSE